MKIKLLLGGVKAGIDIDGELWGVLLKEFLMRTHERTHGDCSNGERSNSK